MMNPESLNLYKETEQTETASPVFKIELPGEEFVDQECLQASVVMILKGWEGERAPDLKLLNRITHKEQGKGIWPGQLLIWLKDRGYEVELYSSFDWEEFAEKGEEYFKSNEFRNKHSIYEDIKAEKRIKNIGLGHGAAITKEMIEKGIPLKKVKDEPMETLIEIFTRLSQGERAILLLNGTHWVPVTGFDGERVSYNDSSGKGLEIDRNEKLESLTRKWNQFGANVAIMMKKEKVEESSSLLHAAPCPIGAGRGLRK